MVRKDAEKKEVTFCSTMHKRREFSKCANLVNFAETCKRKSQAPARPGRMNETPPEGATKGGGALSGRGNSGRRPRRLHRGGARLSRDERGREALLGDDGDVPQRASQHGRAERLLRRRVLFQERQLHRSLISIFSLKIAENFADFCKCCKVCHNLLIFC